MSNIIVLSDCCEALLPSVDSFARTREAVGSVRPLAYEEETGQRSDLKRDVVAEMHLWRTAVGIGLKALTQSMFRWVGSVAGRADIMSPRPLGLTWTGSCTALSVNPQERGLFLLSNTE